MRDLAALRRWERASLWALSRGLTPDRLKLVSRLSASAEREITPWLNEAHRLCLNAVSVTYVQPSCRSRLAERERGRLSPGRP